jgi:hypothetical protein
LSAGAGDEATVGEDTASSANTGNAIDTAKAITVQNMRLIEVMGAEARK